MFFNDLVFGILQQFWLKIDWQGGDGGIYYFKIQLEADKILHGEELSATAEDHQCR